MLELSDYWKLSNNYTTAQEIPVLLVSGAINPNPNLKGTCKTSQQGNL
jgi:hypothetical protein